MFDVVFAPTKNFEKKNTVHKVYYLFSNTLEYAYAYAYAPSFKSADYYY